MRFEKLKEHIRNGTATAKEFENTIKQERLNMDIILLISEYYKKDIEAYKDEIGYNLTGE